MNYQDKSLQSLKLGQATEYAANYDRTLLQPVPRKLNRDGLGITEQQPFTPVSYTHLTLPTNLRV